MWVKVCGLNDPEIARQVAREQPDAVGLNFYPRSRRKVDLPIARQIVSELPPEIEPIGLFVNSPASEIRQIASDVGLKTVQLHGDEPVELLAELPGLRVIRAFRMGPDGLGDLWAYLERADQLGCRPWAVLIDAYVPGEFGGTGQTAPWEQLARDYRSDRDPPLILAGGLHAENVLDAIRQVQPFGVDVAGGVENDQGCKDPARVRQFVAAARSV